MKNNIEEYKQLTQTDYENPIPDNLWKHYGERLFRLYQKVGELCHTPELPEFTETNEKYLRLIEEFYLKVEDLKCKK